MYVGRLQIRLYTISCEKSYLKQGGDYFTKCIRIPIQVVQIYFGVESFGTIISCTSQCSYGFCKCQKIKFADIWAKRPLGPKIKISETQQIIYHQIQNFMLIIIHKKTTLKSNFNKDMARIRLSSDKLLQSIICIITLYRSNFKTIMTIFFSCRPVYFASISALCGTECNK